MPTGELFTKSKHLIVGYWEIIEKIDPTRFNREVETSTLLPDDNWQNVLFGQLSTTVEMTALQRGVVRWSLN